MLTTRGRSKITNHPTQFGLGACNDRMANDFVEVKSIVRVIGRDFDLGLGEAKNHITNVSNKFSRVTIPDDLFS